MTAVMDRSIKTDPRRVVAVLAGWEAKRSLRLPVLWLGAVAAVVVVYLKGRYQAISMPNQSVLVAGSCLAIAAVALLNAHAMATRGSGPEMEEALTTVPTDGRSRRGGELVASFAPALLAVAVVTVGLIWSMTRNPAGSINWLEVLVGPLVVVLAHVIGVALGGLRHPLVGPLVLVILAGLFLVKDLWPGERVIPAASPFLAWRAPYTDWVQGEPRLPLVHLGYLGALIGLIGAVAVRAWRWILGFSVALGAGGLVLAGIPSGGEEVAASVNAWAVQQPVSCEERNGMRYCAFEGYEPWIDYWSEVVERTKAVLPVEPGVKEIRQSAVFMGLETDPQVAYVGGRWHLGPNRGRSSGLAIELLAPTLDLPGTQGELALHRTDLPECMRWAFPLSVFGQARGVGLLALLEIAVAGALPNDAFGGSAAVGHVELSPAELDLGRQILTIPTTETLEILHEHWDEMIDPGTTSAALASWFGLEPPTVPESSPSESMFENATCICTGDGGVQCTSGST